MIHKISWNSFIWIIYHLSRLDYNVCLFFIETVYLKDMYESKYIMNMSLQTASLSIRL